MIETRTLEPADAAAAWRQDRAAFGSPPTREASLLAEIEQGLFLGVFDAGKLVGLGSLRPYRQWYAGRDLPMIGLGSVSVAAHARGRGVARGLLQAALERMYESGVAVSALYPSSPPVYRATGWESAGVYAGAEVSLHALAGLRAGSSLAEPEGKAPVELRPAEAGDVATVHALYTAAVRHAVGPLTRTGPLFDPARVLELDGVILAERDGSPVGYVSYDRGGESGLVVHDLVGSDPAVLAALLRNVAAWRTLTANAWLRAVDPALLSLVTPVPLRVTWREPWMARLVDAPAAVRGRGWPADLQLGVDLELIDPDAAWHTGRWRLELSHGSGTLEPGGTGAVRVHIRGLSALFTGFASTVALRAAGLLDGDTAAAARLDAAFAGQTPWMVDYF